MCSLELTPVPASSRQPYRRWLGAVLLCLIGGCGAASDQRPPLHPTQGSLMINGQPAEGALLVFYAAEDEPLDDRGTRPTATVDADGSFALTTYQDGDGAPAGEYHVAILWFDNLDSSSPWDKLGNRFAHPTATDIRITVEPDQTQLAPIRIDGAALLPHRPGGNGRDVDQVD